MRTSIKAARLDLATRFRRPERKEIDVTEAMSLFKIAGALAHIMYPPVDPKSGRLPTAASAQAQVTDLFRGDAIKIHNLHVQETSMEGLPDEFVGLLQGTDSRLVHA